MDGYPPMLGCIPDDPATRARCAELAGEAALYPYPGSVPDDCSRCRCKVWVGPNQQRLRSRNPHLKVVCLPCTGEVFALAGCGTAVGLSDKPWPTQPPADDDPLAPDLGGEGG